MGHFSTAALFSSEAATTVLDIINHRKIPEGPLVLLPAK